MSYAELKSYTHYSFLRGASSPEEMMRQASQLGLHSLAVTDKNGVYGIPKAYLAIKDRPTGAAGTRLIVGAEITMRDLPALTLLARDRAAYGCLCRLITTAHADKPKGEAALNWDELLRGLTHPGSAGLIALPELAPELHAGEDWDWGVLQSLFGDRLSVPLSRGLEARDRENTARALGVSRRYEIPIVAVGNAHAHVPSRRMLQDTMTCIREGVTLNEAGYRLFANGERHLKSAADMSRLFPDLPQALTRTVDLAESCTFSPAELRYRYPSEWIPATHTAQSFLTELTWEGARTRYPAGVPASVQATILHELKLIGELNFPDYFLTIWDIVKYARSRDILCQGRGSAANSVVCYCLEITALDPTKIDLLFERFISAERGEPPDIDVDFEHERREEVIQYIYEKYGRDRAAMVAAVITYKKRSKIREVTKVFGMEMDLREYQKRGDKIANGELRPSPEETARDEQITGLIDELSGFPRHLSIHSGGFTLSADPIVETVPVEPARMEGRTIVQWDKYDLDALGLLKVDVLSLGMLSALKKAMRAVGPDVTLASIPQDDKATYDMICEADTVGTFQIESRAQMSMLPRLLPRTFYDLVIEVALVRPGPITGNMVHPYLKRRRGEEPVALPDPRLEPILGRTLGVPLFQEQVMQMAISLAGFTPGEADQLRRAIGAWRSSGSIDIMGRRLMDGLLASGLPQSFADLIFSQVQGFAEYGFPESHAASFAHLAYVSAYLKRHHPAEFTCALLNSQPMGFYQAHTLIDDAKRHGVRVLPIDPNISEWDCALEDITPENSRALRVGLRYVQGMRKAEAQALVAERERGGRFRSLSDFVKRAHIRPPILHRLALGNAFEPFGFDRRNALWAILEEQPIYGGGTSAEAGEQLTLFQNLSFARDPTAEARLAKLDDYGELCADYDSYRLSTLGHPMQALRKKFPRLPKVTTADVRRQ
ncbi:MAG: error-prone DNA polymerase, partial [Bacteriovoracia bacterium]